MIKKVVTVAIAGVIGLTGCQNMSNEDLGTLTGAVAGAALGNQFGKGGGKVAMTMVGAVAGSFVGNAIGRTMDQRDQATMVQALNSTPNGQAYGWQNANSGNTYSVQPTRSYYQNIYVNQGGQQAPAQQYCREYRQTAVIAGRQQQLYGTACRQPDGTWQMAQ